MEEMRIDAKTGYNNSRIINGHGPHKLLEMTQEQGLSNRISKAPYNLDDGLSTRNLDHCTCGHARVGHEDFKNGCSECSCTVFHRGIRMQTDYVQP
jgi:hypothetical protein